MDKEVIYILLITAVIFGGLIIFAIKQKKDLLESGKIRDRRHNFMEYSETFTLHAITPEVYKEALRSGGVMEVASGNLGRLKLKGAEYEAELIWLEAPEDQSVFRFRFLSWKTRNGISTSDLAQNMLLTRVEKMFLALDPEAKVTYKKEDVR